MLHKKLGLKKHKEVFAIKLGDFTLNMEILINV
jgi:hypothetical protein